MFHRNDLDKKLMKPGAPTDEEFTLILTTLARVLNIGVVGRLKGQLRFPQPRLVVWAKEWQDEWNKERRTD